MAGRKKSEAVAARSVHKPKWLVACYRPTTLFSLRMSHSTSSGGKTLFVPTPYAFKLALVDASFRAEGTELAMEIFHAVKDRPVRFKPPRELVVNHTFIKIKREPKTPTPENPYISTIGFREYCYFRGELQVAVDIGQLDETVVNRLRFVMAHINYLGKRGSFMQFTRTEICDHLPDGFTLPVPEELHRLDINIYKVAQFLDDIGETEARDIFERINTFSSAKIELNKHRIFKQHLLPYALESSSKNYTYYRNLSAGGHD
ncbi:hypothetical protein [Sporolituus thermophilus]|uniref:Uncharacterized protein n=1 Tax=Sporolituus thermophilus DSM 23256 TaxID=1123285 RepID=A0A1G7P333_9FIRM|nr:hypothetical protein [Sporolituus thermophilus]SDF80673.1 hypothetical protein SAMN05660235_02819 [Sporolituus thermophilus DSM 23256]